MPHCSLPQKILGKISLFIFFFAYVYDLFVQYIDSYFLNSSQAIADSKNVRSHTREFELCQQVDELDDSSTDADADDEETEDCRQESEDENRADGQGKISFGADVHKKRWGIRGRSYEHGHGRLSAADEATLDDEYSADDDCSDLRHRDTCGNMWSNSEVFTSVRVHVADGEAIAPIYDEYLRHLRAKGFVESWSW